jgi:hypothetical protein
MPIDSVMERLRRHYGMAPGGVVDGLETDWESIVGPEVASRSHPRELRGGELVVEVRDTATAQVIPWSTDDIVASLVRHGHDGKPIRVRTKVVRTPRR